MKDGGSVSWADPKSEEELRKLADKRRNGEQISKNDQWELDQARKRGVKNVFTDKD